ncbi:MAG: TatD family hydrolase [Proteobacteria bacterium]|nr:TatD family hydrolase [Pseudomonadota bacterium]
MLIDIGANLTHESFEPDFDEVLARAHQAGVAQLVVTGASAEGSVEAAKLAERHETLYATAGIHPHHAAETTASVLSQLRDLLTLERVKAVGETGLDFFRDISPRPIQEKSFEQHIELAIETGLPMFLHERDAYPRFAEILHAYRDDLGPVVVHCFTGEKPALYAYLDLDCHIGITGWICDERRGTHLLELVPAIPANRLMIETDSPYLMPRNMQPKPKTRRNEPANLTWVCETVARCRQESDEQLAAATTATARAFFGLPDTAE